MNVLYTSQFSLYLNSLKVLLHNLQPEENLRRYVILWSQWEWQRFQAEEENE